MPVRRIRGIRSSIPGGFVIGRLGVGNGPPQLIKIGPTGLRAGSQSGAPQDTGGAGSTNPSNSFLGLTDTPNSYSGQATKVTRVNAGATALEFFTSVFTALADVPSSYSGQAGKLVRVNAGATALEFFTATFLSPDTTANFTVGYTATGFSAGTISSGTFTPAPASGNLQYLTNGGAFTFAAPTAAGDYTIVVKVLNNASAGTITFTGFTKQTGDAMTTTNGHIFFLYITKINGTIHLNVQAMQ